MSTKIVCFESEKQKREEKGKEIKDVIKPTYRLRIESSHGSLQDYLANCEIPCQSKRDLILIDIFESIHQY
jgi:hypothetical protein